MLFNRNKIKTLEAQIAGTTTQIRELEKTIHINESKFLENKNNLEINHHAEQRALREKSFKEGIEHGKAEREKDHIIEITNLRSEYREKISVERDEAAKSARDILRAELETQTKMFSVVIRPYVKIEKNEGVIRSSNKSLIGYQYQLLVNGIPAFQPHVVIENREESKIVDKEMIQEFIKIADKAAKMAANTYLGGAPASVIQIGSEVIEQVKV